MSYKFISFFYITLIATLTNKQFYIHLHLFFQIKNKEFIICKIMKINKNGYTQLKRLLVTKIYMIFMI